MVVEANASPAGPRPASRRRSPRRRSLSGWRLVAGYALVSSLLALGLAVSGVTAAVSAPAADPGAVIAVTVAGRGQELFLTSCAACHGPQGAGTANGPDIRSAGAALADFALRTGRMPLGDQGPPARRGTPKFDDADIRALVAYVASLGHGPAIPNVVVSGADLNAGRDLFVANCSACHGPAAGGGAVGGGFVAPALTSADPTTVGEAVVTGPGPMPRFSLSPQELDNLAAYVQFLHDPPHPGGATAPAVGPVTEGFVAALALLGLLLVARWVAVRREREVPA
jgi:quinol---cytochrome-c reductase cytochrome c subunit